MGRRPAPDHQHGNHTGFIMHLQRKTEPCPWCRRGNNTWRTRQRQRGKCVTGLGWPILSAKEAGRA